VILSVCASRDLKRELIRVAGCHVPVNRGHRTVRQRSFLETLPKAHPWPSRMDL
jgi:hypothetical protein